MRADGSAHKLGEPGTLLGVISEPELMDTEVDIYPDDIIAFHTDGITEERGPEIEPLWLPRLLSTCGSLSAGAIAEKIELVATQFLPGNPRDDIALLVLRAAPNRLSADTA